MNYLDEILGELDFQELDSFTQKIMPQKTSFSDLILQLIDQGLHGLVTSGFWEKVKDFLFFEVAQMKPVCISVLAVACLFSLVQKLLLGKRVKLSDMSFLVLYSTIMILLIQSFESVMQLVEGAVENLISFMTAFIPVYSTCLYLGGNTATAGAFYELAFGLIYALEWGIKVLLIPGIHFFVFVEFLNHIFEEEKLSKLAELLESLIGWLLKIAFAVVAGLGVIQSLLSPAKDRLAQGGILKGLGAVPGVGNSASSLGEVLLSCGMIIKNGVGTVGMIVLFLICLTPLAKVFIINQCYRFLAAILEPIADQRIVGCTHGIARACELYQKILLYAMLLFLLVIAMISASSTFAF